MVERMISSLVFLLIIFCYCSAELSALDVLWSILTYSHLDDNQLHLFASFFGHKGKYRYMLYCNETEPTSGSYSALPCGAAMTIESIPLSLETTDPLAI